MKIISFDIGSINLAVRAEKIENNIVKSLIFERVNFLTTKIDTEFFKELNKYLDTLNIKKYDLVLIEEQMTSLSPKNARIQTFFESYMTIKYPDVKVVLVNSKLKYPKELKGKTVTQRKKWASEKVKELFHLRKDFECFKIMEQTKKSDDLADSVLLIFGYFQKNPHPEINLEKYFCISKN